MIYFFSMKKLRIILLILSMAGFIAACYIEYDLKGNGSFAVASPDVIGKLEKKTKELDKSRYVLSIRNKGKLIPVESDTFTWYIPADMETDEWEEFDLEVSFKDDDDELYEGDIVFETDIRKEDKRQCIRSGKAFPFHAVCSEGYMEGNVVFTGLSCISFLTTDENASDGSVLYDLTVTPADGSEAVSVKTTAALHGNTSLSYDKKSLRLRLQKKENLLGLRNDDDWVLNSLYADETRIRDLLCIKLWNEVGANVNPYGKNFGTAAEFCEVFINDHYQGIYALMVPIDAKQVGSEKVSRQIEAGRKNIERIYKKKYTDEFKSEYFKGEIPDPAMPDYRGGFYLKGDTILQNEEEWVSMYELSSLLEDPSDEAFVSGMKETTDIRNVIDNWLFYQLICGVDNENKNFYYVTKDDGDGLKGYFIPWDMNLSLGDVYTENDYYSSFDLKVYDKEVLWEPGERLVRSGDEEVKALLLSEYERMRMGAFSDVELSERIKALEHKVKDSGALLREIKRYPEGNTVTDFSHLYDFAVKRTAYVDELVKGYAK